MLKCCFYLQVNVFEFFPVKYKFSFLKSIKCFGIFQLVRKFVCNYTFIRNSFCFQMAWNAATSTCLKRLISGCHRIVSYMLSSNAI